MFLRCFIWRVRWALGWKTVVKIAYVVPNIRNCGPVNVMLGIANFLAGNNKIFIISVFGDRDDSNLVKKYANKNINIESLALTKKDFLLNGAKQLSDKIQLISPDIVHSHGLQADILVARLEGKFKKISTIHSNILEDFKYQFGNIKSIPLIKYRLKIMKRFNMNVCCSRSVYDALFKKTFAQMTYIRNGVDIKKYKSDDKIKKEIRKELGVPLDSKIYLTSAPLVKRKRVFELVQLFDSILKGNEFFVVIGEGPELLNCKKINNKHIFLLGYVDDPIKYYIASDVYVSNSASEGLPMSVLEAIASSNLLLLSDIPAHRECLEIMPNTYFGNVFSEDNFADVFRAVSNQITVYEGKTFDKYNISNVRMGEEYLELYKEIRNE